MFLGWTQAATEAFHITPLAHCRAAFTRPSSVRQKAGVHSHSDFQEVGGITGAGTRNLFRQEVGSLYMQGGFGGGDSAYFMRLLFS